MSVMNVGRGFLRGALVAAAFLLVFVPARAGQMEPGRGGEHRGRHRPEPQVVFDNGNIDRVYNGPLHATAFSIDRPLRVALVQTYHWNDGAGAAPGRITLLDDAGQQVGVWAASGAKGQSGKIAYWVANPGIVLRPGRYRVYDSDPATWSHNGGTGGSGMTKVTGVYE